MIKMKDTGIPLDIAFISEKGIIKRISTLKPFDETIHSSVYPVKYVLEVNKGFFDSHKIGLWDKVEFPSKISNIKVE